MEENQGVTSPGGATREEKRFFTKSRQIPGLGRTDLFLYAGAQLENQRSRQSDHDSGLYAQGGLSVRVSSQLAFSASVELAADTIASEISATYLAPIVQVRAIGVVDSAGTMGGGLQVSSTGTSPVNFNFDMRRVSRNGVLNSKLDPSELADAEVISASNALVVRGSFTQLGGLVSYNLSSVRFLATGLYREDAGHNRRFSFGPAVEWDFLRHGDIALTARGDLNITERGKSGFAGISLRVLAPHSTLSALVGVRKSGIGDDDLGEGGVLAVAGSAARKIAGGDLSLGAGLEHQPKRDSAIFTSDYRHPNGSLSADLSRTSVNGSGSAQYSLGLHTTLAAGAGKLAVAGDGASESLLVVKVDGAAATDSFDVIVNEQSVGTARGSDAFIIALPAYRSYDVRIRPTGDRLLAYSSAARSVALYPGTVAKADWTVAPISLQVGRLMAPDGTPVVGAVLTARGSWAETDDSGLFQIEAPIGAELIVSLLDGTTSSISLPQGERVSEAVGLGTIVCCQPTGRLSLVPSSNLTSGD